MDFSVTVLKAVDSIKGHYALVNQIERSATSIGANIHEANYAPVSYTHLTLPTNSRV